MIEKRKNNFVIFRAPELNTNVKQERITYDLKVVKFKWAENAGTEDSYPKRLQTSEKNSQTGMNLLMDVLCGSTIWPKQNA